MIILSKRHDGFSNHHVGDTRTLAFETVLTNTYIAYSVGPALIGVFLDVILQGALGIQCCVYYASFAKYVQR